MTTQLTKQEIFDRVAEHLLTQMEKSGVVDETCGYGFRCLYRGPNGLKCAAGALIPDELYDPCIEDVSIESDKTGDFITSETLRLLVSIREKCGIEEEKDFVRELQKIHDEFAPEYWEIELKELAKENDLEYKGYGSSKTSN